MTNRIASWLAAAVLTFSAVARADSCYSNSQCPEGTICWGGECRSSLGRSPSASRRSGEVNWLFLGIGTVVVLGVIYWFAIQPGGPLGPPAALRGPMPPPTGLLFTAKF